MHRLYNLKETLVDELKQLGSKDRIELQDLELVDKLAHAVKNLCKIIESYEEEEYSEAQGGSYAGSYATMPRFRRGSYARGGSMAQGSYARGRGANARRDSMGRYASAGDFRMELEEIMQDAPNEAVRQKLAETMNMM